MLQVFAENKRIHCFGRLPNWIKDHPRSVASSFHDLFQLQIKDVTLKDAGWYDCQVNTSPKISNKSYLQVTEFDPLAVQEPTAANIEKQHDSPAQHGQVIPQIQEFLLRGGQMVF